MQAPPVFSYRPYWAKRFGIAPFLPTSRAEMDELGWDSCDIVIVSGDAYVDHPSFGMAIIGRFLEAQGFRVGILAQPDWHRAEVFTELGQPNLFFGITAGNMDSLVNHYTSDRKLRHNDAYTPNDEHGKRPDRATIVYAQRCREAYREVPQVLGGIEASLRRIAHFDYWSEKVRRSILVDSKADILLYGNAERALAEIAHRLAKGEVISSIRDVRGTAFMHKGDLPEGWLEVDSSHMDTPGKVDPLANPYDIQQDCASNNAEKGEEADNGVPIKIERRSLLRHPRDKTAVRLPAFEQVAQDKVLYAHASRTFHLETNPGNARVLLQRHADRDVWINPPPLPLSTTEMDQIFALPFARQPHPRYGEARIPAYEMIRFSVNIMRGCFGGCTFCSITEHEGRIIQSRSEQSILREIEEIRDKTPGFTGIISDLGGPTANMYRLGCKSADIEKNCRKFSCVFPGICPNLSTNHHPLVRLYRKARAISGVKKILISSGLRYDLAVESPEYIKELVTHHVGGYLKIAPEHTETGPLSKMMKPGMGTYDRFKQLFDKYSKEAGKEQYLIPYFIAAHPGTTDEDMMNLALWLKRHGFRADQVQAYLPTPMSLAAAMFHTERNPLKKIAGGETVFSAKGLRNRRLHKAFLRYHDAENWPLLREALQRMGHSHLIGNGKQHLVPTWQPAGTGLRHEGRRKPQTEQGNASHHRSNPHGKKPRFTTKGVWERPAPQTASKKPSGAKPAASKPKPAHQAKRSKR